jgi:acyl dehydratase
VKDDVTEHAKHDASGAMKVEDQPPEGRITEEGLSQLRDMIGRWLRTEHYTDQASIDTMKRFVNGCGDMNPLFRDREHARRSPYGDIIAHPTFPYARHYPGRTRFGLRGVHGFYAGTDWEFYGNYRIGDLINCRERLIDVRVKESEFSGQLVIMTCECLYTNDRGELIAKAYGWSTRHERRASRERSKYKDVAAYDYSQEELDAIVAEALTERSKIRGAEPLFWEDVHEGDELPRIIRGPLSLMDITGWTVGVGRSRTHGLALEDAQRHPAHFFRNQDAGRSIEYTGMGHARESVARDVGAPGAYDYGPQRITWTASLITNWIGDYGILRRLRGEVRRFNVIGDTTYCTGKVARKYVEDGEHRVEIEMAAVNQRGEVTCPGLAVVSLPTQSVALPNWLQEDTGKK